MPTLLPKLVESYRFLGVTVDNGLRFTEHISSVIEKSRKRVQILKCMAWKYWGNTIEVQRTLYLQFCRSVLEFSSSAFTPLIEKTKLEQLERIQNEGQTVQDLPSRLPQTRDEY